MCGTMLVVLMKFAGYVTQMLKVWLKSVLHLLKNTDFFYRLFLLAHPMIMVGEKCY